MKQKSVRFRFYEELNDFLPLNQRKKQFYYYFTGTPTVKDAIEAIGVPHPEIDLILVNGTSVGFNHHIMEGDIIAVYPVFESLDISPLVRLRNKSLRNPRFILDVHLGKLAKLLRLLGFDSLYDKSFQDKDIIKRSLEDNRIILSRDKKLLKIKKVTHGYWLRSDIPESQIREVLIRLDLFSQIKCFTRCILCNGNIKKVEKNAIIKKIPANTAIYYQDFWNCEGCGNIYWQGSHYVKMQKKLSKILKRNDK